MTRLNSYEALNAWPGQSLVKRLAAKDPFVAGFDLSLGGFDEATRLSRSAGLMIRCGRAVGVPVNFGDRWRGKAGRAGGAVRVRPGSRKVPALKRDIFTNFSGVKPLDTGEQALYHR